MPETSPGMTRWREAQSARLRIAAIVSDGHTYRFSQKLIKDNCGVDYCVGVAGAHTCIVILAVGPFIEETNVPVPVN